MVLLAITRVCSAWRHIAFATPSLWNEVMISRDCPTNPFPVVSLFLNRGSSIIITTGIQDLTIIKPYARSVLTALKDYVGPHSPDDTAWNLPGLKSLSVDGSMAFLSAVSTLFRFVSLTTLSLHSIKTFYPYYLLDRVPHTASPSVLV